MPLEILLLLLAWAATVTLIVVVPWVVVRLAVRVLESDVTASLERWLPETPEHEQSETTGVLRPNDGRRDGDHPSEAVSSNHETQRR